MKDQDEIDFNPPHGKHVHGVVYDGVHISFWLENGQQVTLSGTVRFFSTSFTDDEDIPETVSGIFYGDYSYDDFTYPVEVHFEDTTGVIYERPRKVPENCWLDNVCPIYLSLKDPLGHTIPLIREPNVDWQPDESKMLGRIGHLLFKY